MKSARALFNIPPLRQIRDGMLKLGYRLDPSLSGLKEEVQWIKERAALRQIEELEHWSWHRLDPLQARLLRSLRRQQLRGRSNWRYGPDYLRLVAADAFQALTPHTSLNGARCLDLGCGNHNPVGVASLLYLNGAADAMALDMEPADRRRAAEALHDLLADCSLYPGDWNYSQISREEFLARIQRFNRKALRNGDLDSGLAGVPVRYVVTDVHRGIPGEPGSIDIMVSRDVLEHIQDIPKALSVFREAIRPGGISYHHVDLVDHRIYKNLDPADYTPEYLAGKPGYPRNECHPWSFLTEPEDYQDRICNRMRVPEYRAAFVQAGFEILSESSWRERPPAGLREQLSPRFANLTDEDLAICQMDFILRRT